MAHTLLIQPPIEDFYLTAKRTQPYGLATIAAALRQSGSTVEIIDALATAKSRPISWPAEMRYLSPFFGRPDRSPFGLFHQYRCFGSSIEHIVRLAKSSGASLIGISSLFSAYSDVAMRTAKAVRNACPDAVLVLGGHHPTTLPEAVMRYEHVDFVIRGDGEIALPQLARTLQQKGRMDSVPGLVRRRQDGSLKVAPPALNESLDALPVAAFDLISWKYYRRSGLGSLSISATRGCPLRCTYCAINAATFHGYRQRSVASVLEELDAAQAHTPLGFVDFEDEHLSADKPWFMDLLAGLKQRRHRGRPEIRAMNGLYASSLDDEILEAMAKAGFKTVNLALITTDSKQLRRFSRHNLNEALDRVIAWSRKFGLRCVAYLMVSGPEQEPQQSVDDLLYLARRPILAGVSVFYPAPGSRDYQWCQRKGLLPDRNMLMRSTALPLEHRTDRTQTVTLLRLGRILNFIKHLLDMGETLPCPARPPKTVSPVISRDELGRQLLGGFFHDASVYGADDDGRIYRHQVDSSLTRRFVQGLGRQDIKGVVA